MSPGKAASRPGWLAGLSTGWPGTATTTRGGALLSLYFSLVARHLDNARLNIGRPTANTRGVRRARVCGARGTLCLPVRARALQRDAGPPDRAVTAKLAERRRRRGRVPRHHHRGQLARRAFWDSDNPDE